MPRPVAADALRYGLLLSLSLTRASADLLPVGPGDFSGSETVITFGGLTAGEPVAANYLGQDVFFGAGLFGAVPNTATNSAGGPPATPIEVDFLEPPALVGFDVSAASPALLEFIALDGHGVLTNTVPFLIGAVPSFVGVRLDSGITQLWIDEAGTDPYFMQNFRFEALPVVVPEASSAALAAAAIAGALWLSRGRRRRGWSGLCESEPSSSYPASSARWRCSPPN